MNLKCLAVLLMIGSLASVAVGKDFDPQGGGGDGQYPDMCPDGSFVAGFHYRSGAWMDSIQLECAAVSPDGKLGARQRLKRRGGFEGAAHDAFCPANQFVHGIHYKLTIANQVKWVDVFCADLAVKEFYDFRIGNGGPGAAERPEVIVQGCGKDSNEAVRGITIHAGSHVNALGAACRPKTIPGCLVAGVLRKDIAASDCEEAQTTGCIRHLLSEQQYAACIKAQPKKKYHKFNDKSVERRCGTYADWVLALVSKARSKKCDFLNGEGIWRKSKDELFASCVASNAAEYMPNVTAVGRSLEQCEGGGGNANASKVEILAGNKVYADPNGGDTPANTVCVVTAGDTGDLLAKGPALGFDASWFKVGNISGACGGKSGWIWDNGGELKVP